MNLGWSCMSWRQPVRAAAQLSATVSSRRAERVCAGELIRHLRNFLGMEPLKKTFGVIEAKLRIFGFNAQKEPVAAGAHKVGRIEDRMIRPGQPVERQHANHSSQRSSPNPAFKSNGNELRHHSVDSRIHFGRGAHCFTFACGSRVRISKTEIEGMTRMKKKNSIVNRPMVPIKIIRSHLVYQYMPQELGRKSRCRLVTTITKRSSHIPVLTTSDTRNNCQGVERTLFSHST